MRTPIILNSNLSDWIIHLAIITLFFTANTTMAQKKEVEFHYDQYVFISLKDGSEVPGKISSIKSKKQYYVRMLGGKRSGLVSRKFIRAMTPREIEEIKERSRKSSSKAIDLKSNLSWNL